MTNIFAEQQVFFSHFLIPGIYRPTIFNFKQKVAMLL